MAGSASVIAIGVAAAARLDYFGHAVLGLVVIDSLSTALRLRAGGFDSALVVPAMVGAPLRSVGPFVLIAHALPTSLTPGELPDSEDVRPHLHIGMAALSYLYEGAMTHRDSLGNRQEIDAGSVSWTVAGRGIVHSERYEALRRDGGTLHGLQIWVALPAAEEDCEPSFTHHAASALPVIEKPGIHGRLIAGTLDGQTSPVEVRSPLYLADLKMGAGAVAASPSEMPERAVYVVEGAITRAETRIEAGQACTFTPGAEVQIVAEQPSRVLWFGGEPIGTRYVWWNFVATTMERIEAGRGRWREGPSAMPPDDRDDFTPLPADGERPLMTLNA